MHCPGIAEKAQDPDPGRFHIRKAFAEEIPGTTKLIIAQRVASVQDADMIVIMDNGMVAAVGTHEQLLASSTIYQEVYYSQKKGGDE